MGLNIAFNIEAKAVDASGTTSNVRLGAVPFVKLFSEFHRYQRIIIVKGHTTVVDDDDVIVSERSHRRRR